MDSPSAWVARFAPLIPAGEVLDLACGRGRNARFLAARGYRVLALDRDAAALTEASGPGVQVVQFDLEQGASWPLEPARFAGVVVTNYLHRPLFPHLFESLAPGGVLIYETFAEGNQQFGKPSRPEFLLQRGELLDAARTRDEVQVLAFEDGYVARPRAAMVQRICAIRTGPGLPADALRLD